MSDFTDTQLIRNFKSLVKYLRTEFNWPVDEDDADELKFK